MKQGRCVPTSFSRLDPLWVRNQSNTINAQEFQTRMGREGCVCFGREGYYNNINNGGYRRLHTAGYLSRILQQQQHQQSDIGDYTHSDIVLLLSRQTWKRETWSQRHFFNKSTRSLAVRKRKSRNGFEPAKRQSGREIFLCTMECDMRPLGDCDHMRMSVQGMVSKVL